MALSDLEGDGGEGDCHGELGGEEGVGEEEWCECDVWVWEGGGVGDGEEGDGWGGGACCFGWGGEGHVGGESGGGEEEGDGGLFWECKWGGGADFYFVSFEHQLPFSFVALRGGFF